MAAMAGTTSGPGAQGATRARWPNHDGSAPEGDAIVFGEPDGIGSIVSVSSVLGTPFEKVARRRGRGGAAFVFALAGAFVGFLLFTMSERGAIHDAMKDAGVGFSDARLGILFGGTTVLFAVVGFLVWRSAVDCTWIGTEGIAWFTRRGERVRRKALLRFEDAVDCDVRRVRTKMYGAAVSDSCVWQYKDARGRRLLTLAAAWSPNREPGPENAVHFGMAAHHAWQRFRSRGLVTAIRRETNKGGA